MPTVLLVHCDGTNGSTTFTDTWGGHTLARTATAAVSTAQVKFGTGSLGCATSGAVQATTGLSDFDFQSGPFTVEAWAYATSAPNIAGIVAQFANSSGSGWLFGTVSGNLVFWYYDGTGTVQTFGSSTAIATGGWHFYTADRDAGGTLRIYIDGVVVASTSAPTFQSALQTLNIGNTNRVTDAWPGYIDEVRVTKGTALYAGAFTPPTGPFADPVTSARATQVALEHWVNANADARLTQIFLEHWGPAGTSQPQAVLTQMALEQWFSVATAAPAAQQARAIMMA